MAGPARPHVLSMVLAGGEGKRLLPLTRDRAKPAVPFGGKYRLIDFALSNLVNGGFRRIVVLTQYKSHSLNVHVARAWRLSSMLGNYVTSVPAQMRRGARWFLGSADALYQNLNILDDEQPDYVFVFGADHIYRMDPSQMLEAHLDTKAGATVSAIRVPVADAHQFGVIQRGETTKIESFLEKPDSPPPSPDDPDTALVSMGNYIFTTEFLLELLAENADDELSKHDVGGDLIPKAVAAGEAHVYDFTTNLVPGVSERERAYWRDVGTLDSYYAANMDLVSVEPVFNLYNDYWPLYTSDEVAPPAKLVAVAEHGAGQVADTILSEGTVISGAYVRSSVLSPWVRIEPGASVENSVLMRNVVVGSGAVVRNAIVDKNVRIPPGSRIGVDLEEDARRFTVSTGGIVVLAKNEEISPPD